MGAGTSLGEALPLQRLLVLLLLLVLLQRPLLLAPRRVLRARRRRLCAPRRGDALVTGIAHGALKTFAAHLEVGDACAGGALTHKAAAAALRM